MHPNAFFNAVSGHVGYNNVVVFSYIRLLVSLHIADISFLFNFFFSRVYDVIQVGTFVFDLRDKGRCFDSFVKERTFRMWKM